MLKMIPIDRIVVSLSFREVNHKHCDDLAESIRTEGLLNPLTVRMLPDSDFYELVNGRHRLAAVEKLGHTEVACQVLTLTDVEAAQINIMTAVQRVPVKPNEYGNQIDRLLKNMSIEELAAKLSMTVVRLKELHDKRDK